MPRRSLNVILDLTSRCNLKCTMCYFAVVDRIRFDPMDREPTRDGSMPLATFETLAADLFPSARRVALACAAEPLIHPQFQEIVAAAGRYSVPDLWFPTNLLALTEKKALALVDAGVAVVAASVDGFTQESYEAIRAGGKWRRFLERLSLLEEVKARTGASQPRLRLIFTWMKSNREQLRQLPEFAAKHGATEVDVRYVCPTEEVDNSAELLLDQDPGELNRELAETATELVSRGIRLAAFPAFDLERTGRLPSPSRWLWYRKAGLGGLEQRKQAWLERLRGCVHPGRTFVIRPNGAVFPCHYRGGTPIGFYPEGRLADFLIEPEMVGLQHGLRTGGPVGGCRTCAHSRQGLYRPFGKLLRESLPLGH